MQAIMYSAFLRGQMEKLKSEHSAEREEAALNLLVNLDKLPGGGHIDGIRRKANRTVILPRENVELLLARAISYEQMLRREVEVFIERSEAGA